MGLIYLTGSLRPTEYRRLVVSDRLLVWPDSCDNIKKSTRGEGRAEKKKEKRGEVQKR